jgi:hypothetical protein
LPRPDARVAGYCSALDGELPARVTTTLRKAYVEVTLKGEYAYDSSPLFELAAAVKRAVPAGI